MNTRDEILSDLRASVANLHQIIDGARARRWAAGGVRLRDTVEWVTLANAHHSLTRAEDASDFLPINEEHVLHFALRYALGRMSTAPSIVCDEVTRLWSRVRPATRERMQSEIREAIDRGAAGDACDVARWSEILPLPL